MLVDGNRFNLLQFHFHWPSEHTVNGKQYLMEGHLVHQDAQGNLAVIGVLMERGGTNSALADVWEFMPPTAGSVREPGVSFNVNALLPNDRTTYRYPGSLTTPPCSESVQWMVLKTPMPVSAEQAQLIRGHNRLQQPLHPASSRARNTGRHLGEPGPCVHRLGCTDAIKLQRLSLLNQANSPEYSGNTNKNKIRKMHNETQY